MMILGVIDEDRETDEVIRVSPHISTSWSHLQGLARHHLYFLDMGDDIQMTEQFKRKCLLLKLLRL
jgi:hypothetical protein